jgi:transposase
MRAAFLSAAPLKFVVGIRIAKDSFVTCFGRIDASQRQSFRKDVTFANLAACFTDLLAWTGKQLTAAVPSGSWWKPRACVTRNGPVFWPLRLKS